MANMLEHFEKLKETFDSTYMGVVEDIQDPLACGRAKIRVFGVYDDPIRLAHIPWAFPVDSARRVGVGETVAVFFLRGSHNHPVFY